MMKKVAVVGAALLMVGALLAYLLLTSARKEASMLLLNGAIYTLNDRQPFAEAVAIRGNRIVGVGTSDELRKTYRADTVIDLRGRPVYPGFIDAHAHLEGLGAMLMQLDVSAASSEDEVLSMIAGAPHPSVQGGWIRGRGWDQNRWPGNRFPSRHSLDRVSPDVPVFLKRIDGHAAWVNSKVLALAEITEKTPDPPGGRIIRDTQGQPTGVFIDNAVTLLEELLPAPSEEERAEAIHRAIEQCLACGLTEVHDMGVDTAGIDLYKKLIRQRSFPFRVYVAVEGSLPGAWERYRKLGPITEGYDGRLVVRALKLYADGALGSRGAALLEGYTDDPGNRGLTLTSRADLAQATREALESGFQICTHAIGDRANTIVLDVYEEALQSLKMKDKDLRMRVEHAQVLSPADIPRFHQLGILPVMQPTHCTSDMPWAESRLGPVRIKGAYAWRSLMDCGSIVPGGSDFPVERPNPLWGFYAAITRADRAGNPRGGWYPEQKMTREEALKSFTLWGAYAGFQEKEKGSIEPGKWADLVVLSDDIMKIEPRRIPDVSVEMTMIAGEVVFSSTRGAGSGAK